MNPIHKEQVERTHADFVKMCGAFSTDKHPSTKKMVNARLLTKVIFVTCFVEEKQIPRNLNFSSFAYLKKDKVDEVEKHLDSILDDTSARKTLSALLTHPFAPFKKAQLSDEQKISASLQFMEEITEVLYSYWDNTKLYGSGDLRSEVNRYLDGSLRFDAEVFYPNYLNFQDHKELGIVETSDPSIAMYDLFDFKQIFYRTWEAYIEGKNVPEQVTDLMLDLTLNPTLDERLDALLDRLFYTKGRIKFFTYPLFNDETVNETERPFILIALPLAVAEGFEWSIIQIKKDDEVTVKIDQVPFHGLPFYLQNVLNSARIDELTRVLEDQAKQFIKV